jgi:hypothetical protein
VKPEADVVALWLSLHPKSGFRPTEYQTRKWLDNYDAAVIERAMRAVDSTGSPQKVLRAMESKLLYCSCVERPHELTPKSELTPEECARFEREFEEKEAAAKVEQPTVAEQDEVAEVMETLDNWYTGLLRERENAR